MHLRFTDQGRPGAITYAEEMQAAGDHTDFDVLVEDASGAASEFWALLKARMQPDT